MIEAITSSLAANPRNDRVVEQSNREGSYMQMEDFLQLLTSQISNQDPLEPMKDTEFISQMANIASLEQMQQFTKGFSTFADSQKDMVAQAYLGRQVTIEDDGRVVSGIVSTVEKSSEGKLLLDVDGQKFSPSLVTKVSLAESFEQ